MALPFLVHWIRIFTNLDFFFSFFTTQSISTNTISITCNWKLFKRPEPLCVSCPWICLFFGFGLKIQLFPISLPLVTSRFLKKKRVKLHLLRRFYLDNIQNTSPEKVFKRKKLTHDYFFDTVPQTQPFLIFRLGVFDFSKEVSWLHYCLTSIGLLFQETYPLHLTVSKWSFCETILNYGLLNMW